MEKYSVFIKPSAVKELEAIPQKKLRQQLIKRIRSLTQDPFPPGCQKLSGHARYRIRQGFYRIIYSVEAQQLVIYVIKIGHRKEIYKNL